MWVVKEDLPDHISELKNCLSSFNSALNGAEIANGLDILADPEDVETEAILSALVSVISDIFNPILDAISAVVGALDVNWTES